MPMEPHMHREGTRVRRHQPLGSIQQRRQACVQQVLVQKRLVA